MTRARLLLFVAVAAVIAGAVPGAAASEPTTFTDPCGDATSRVTAGDQSVELEQAQAHLDVAGGSLSNREGGGVIAALELCGAAQPATGRYSLSWFVGESCDQVIAWRKPELNLAAPTAAREAFVSYSETCYGAGPDQNETVTVFDVVLPDEVVTFDGSTVAFTLTDDVIPAAARPRFALGSRWDGPGGLAMDQDTGAWSSSTGLTQDYDVRYRVDYVFSDEDFVIEEV